MCKARMGTRISKLAVLFWLIPYQSHSQGWWNANWQYRTQLTVTAGSAAVPSGYSVFTQFDHASLVSAGKALPSGDDVRIVYWNGSSWTELDRIRDAGSSWNTSATRVWFKIQAAIGVGSSSTSYYMYYSNSTPGSPPTNKANVYLFADDFESGSLSNWTISSGVWAIATDQAHAGTYSLKYPTEGGSLKQI